MQNVGEAEDVEAMVRRWMKCGPGTCTFCSLCAVVMVLCISCAFTNLDFSFNVEVGSSHGITSASASPLPHSFQRIINLLPR